MKYLRIHKVIWFILVLLWTSFEVLIYFIACIIYFLWSFKWIWNWKKFTEGSMLVIEPDGNRGATIVDFSDDSIWDTIVRRYKCDFRI